MSSLDGSPGALAAAAGLIAAAYLVGSIPTGYLVGRRRGVDVRQQGSGNIGATNVARTLGRRLGVLVLVLDALKGAGPVAVWRIADLGSRVPLGGSLAPYLFTAFGLAPIVGHCFPVWLRFRGGKGVATALGVFLVTDPLITLAGLAVFALLYAATKIVSIGSMLAATSIALTAVIAGRPGPVVALAAGGAAIIILKHHQNIRRLLGKKELKV